MFKTVRTVLSMLTRTEYRSVVKIALNSKIFYDKIQVLSSVDFTRIENYKQTNTKDDDILTCNGEFINIKNEIF